MPPIRVAGLLWFAWFLYWMWAARGTIRPEKRESRRSRASHFVPLGIGFALLFSELRLGPLEARVSPELLAWPGVALTAAGHLFAIWARLHLGRYWSGEVQLKEGHKLVTSGPYAFVRNPIYTGLLAAVLGSALALGNWRGVIAFALVLGSFVRKIGIEERTLAPALGAEYDDYRGRVKALFPCVW